MPDILTLAFTHALCNAMAEQQMLATNDILRCSANWMAIKAHFSPPSDPAPGDDSKTEHDIASGYLEWKAWERRHPELVSKLRAQAVAAMSRS